MKKKKSKRTLTPKLRFPEFWDAPAWEEKPLEKLSSIVRGGSPRPIDTFLTNDRNGLNWLKIGDVDRGAKYITRTTEKVRPDALPKTRLIHPGDFILSNSMSFGRPYITEIETCIHDGWIAVTNINDYLDHEFLYYVIVSGESQRYFIDQAAGSGVKNLNIDIVESLPIPHPSSHEQKKIADCLSSLDGLIAAEGRKLTALRDHKQGLMQQLFPQPGQSQPRLRFPEFRDVWNETNLKGECRSVSSGKDKIDPDGEFDLYGSTGVIGKTLRGTYDGKFLLVARVGANAGMLTVATGQFGVTDNTLVIALKNPSKVDFVSQYLENYGLNKLIFGSGQPLITGGQLKALPLYFPREEEQKSIAVCLSALDARIAAQAAKIDALKQHKRGLMQQLFPAPEKQ